MISLNKNYFHSWLKIKLFSQNTLIYCKSKLKLFLNWTFNPLWLHEQSLRTDLWIKNLIKQAQVYQWSLEKLLLEDENNFKRVQHYHCRSLVELKRTYQRVFQSLIGRTKFKINQLEQINQSNLLTIQLWWKQWRQLFLFCRDLFWLPWIMLILSHWVVPQIIFFNNLLIWMPLQIYLERYVNHRLDLMYISANLPSSSFLPIVSPIKPPAVITQT